MPRRAALCRPRCRLCTVGPSLPAKQADAGGDVEEPEPELEPTVRSAKDSNCQNTTTVAPLRIFRYHIDAAKYIVKYVCQNGVPDKAVEARIRHQFVGSFQELPEQSFIPYMHLQVQFELGRTEFYLENYTKAEYHLDEILYGTYPANELLSTSRIHQISGWLGYILFKQRKPLEALQHLLPIQDHIAALYNFDGSLHTDISLLIGYAAHEENSLALAEWKFQLVATKTEDELSKIGQEDMHTRIRSIAQIFHARAWLDSALWKQKKYFEVNLNLRRMLKLADDLQQYGSQTVDKTLNPNYYKYYVWVKLARNASAQNNFSEAITICRKAIHVFLNQFGSDQSTTNEARKFLHVLHELDYNPRDTAMQAQLFQLSNQSLEAWADSISSNLPMDTMTVKLLDHQAFVEPMTKVGTPDIVTQVDSAATVEQSQEATLATTDDNRNAKIIPSTQSKQETSSETLTAEPHRARSVSPAMSYSIDDQYIGTLFEARETSQQIYQESEITDIKAWLQDNKPEWSTSPRTYIIFRMIDRLDLLNQTLESRFSDYQLPVADTSFPRCLGVELHASFKKAQRLVLNTTLELQRKGYGKHHHLGVDETLPFDIKQRLGSGGFSQVDRVVHRMTQREYALKRVPRKAVSDGKRFQGMKGMISEIEILKELRHEHIVELVGSYTDRKFLGLIMSPVAEMDLAVYLAAADSTTHGMIRSFYGCLTTSLQFLHKNQVRHKDIKPQNILVNNGTVLLADFGLARDFKDAEGSTKIGRDNWISPRYAAPEVMLQEARNTKSDIWSLGIVFLEMTVVLKGYNNKWLDDFLMSHGHQSKFPRSNRPGLEELLDVLKDFESKSDNVALMWTEKIDVTGGTC